MGGEEFDSHYEVILTGTDLTSSLLSAALGRIQKKVLHLDSEKHYGKEWRSLRITDLLGWHSRSHQDDNEPEKIEDSKESKEDFETSQEEKISKTIHLERPKRITAIETQFHVFEDPTLLEQFLKYVLKDRFSEEFFEAFREMTSKILVSKNGENSTTVLEEAREKWSAELSRLDNLFIFDLNPRFPFSYGKIVQVLISSSVTRYIEFRKVSRLLSYIDNHLVEVPCTRSEVFGSSIITPIEKRRLMSFLEKCFRLERHLEWYESVTTLPLANFLRDQSLNDKLAKFVSGTLLMDDPEVVPTGQALARIQYFLRCFGRFCDRPFLFPMYGSEDLVQAFCRYGAVWGVLYCLGVPAKTVTLRTEDNSDQNSNQLELDILGQKVRCDHLITDHQIRELEPRTIPASKISRAIILSTRSIKPETGSSVENADLSFLHLSRDFASTGSEPSTSSFETSSETSSSNYSSSVFVFESNHSIRVCPKGFYLQYLWTRSDSNSAKADLEPVVRKLFELESNTEGDSAEEETLPEVLRGQIMASVYFQYDPSKIDHAHSPPSNIHLIPPAINELDYDQAVRDAEAIFRQLYPEEEFFPKTEDPHSTPIQNPEPNEENFDYDFDELYQIEL